MPRIQLPYNGWIERPYQEALWDYLMTGGKRALAVWHRRSGKDDVALHFAAIELHKRVGNGWHALPEYAQGRKALWTAVNPHTGIRRIDEAFPHELRESTNDNEMFIRFKNGSTWQIIGSDRYNATVGASPMLITYSEWALANPSAWAYHRPMLQENDGTALFITTPRGRNHAFEMYKYVRNQPDWFCELLTARDTGALNDQQLNDVLAEMKALYGEDAGRSSFDQEYMCDFSSALLGGFYSRETKNVRDENRIQPIEPIAGKPVHRCWDLGMRDDTAIWMYQAVGPQIFLFDCLSASGASLEWWRDEITRIYEERGWTHGDDWVPHDAKVRELGTGRTRVETMRALGLSPRLSPDASVQDGINAARRLLPLSVFHPRCEEVGFAALEQYRREWDDERKTFRASAVHDWTSHPSDAFRYLALSYRPAPRLVVPEPAMTGWRIPPPSEQRRGGIVL